MAMSACLGNFYDPCPWGLAKAGAVMITVSIDELLALQIETLIWESVLFFAMLRDSHGSGIVPPTQPPRLYPVRGMRNLGGFFVSTRTPGNLA